MQMPTTYSKRPLQKSPMAFVRDYNLTKVGKTLVKDKMGLSFGSYVLQHRKKALMVTWPLLHMVMLDPLVYFSKQ
jgi:hypothetical protein